MTQDQLEEAALNDGDLELEDEIYEPHPATEDVKYDGDFRIPGELYNDLFDYQKTCKCICCGVFQYIHVGLQM